MLALFLRCTLQIHILENFFTVCSNLADYVFEKHESNVYCLTVVRNHSSNNNVSVLYDLNHVSFM